MPANILMRKLEAMNIPDALLMWIEQFLIGRRQRVKISRTLTSCLEVWGTVPQGTLLGVLLFLTLINDLQMICHTIKYVDDTTIYKVLNSVNDNTRQNAVDSAFLW